MLRSSLVYLLSSTIGKAVPFLLLPVLTRYMTPAELGLVALFQLWIQLGQSVFGLSLNVNIPRHFFSCGKAEISSLFFNIYVVLFFSCILGFLVLLGIAVLSGKEEVGGLSILLLLIIPLLALMGMSNLLSQTLLRTLERPFSFMLFEVGFAALNGVLVLVFVVALKMAWLGQVYAIIASMLVFGLLGFFTVRHFGYWRGGLSAYWVGDILKVSLPLIPHAIAGVVISVGGRYFIEEQIGVEALGVYVVGYYFGMVIMLFSEAFIRAWTPWFFKRMSSGVASDKKLIVRGTYLFILLMLFGALAYSAVAVFFLPYVVPEEYWGAAQYIPWICMGYVFYGVYQIFFPYFLYLKKTTLVAVATVVAAIANILGNYYLIEKYGVVGSAYSTIIAFSVSSLIVTLYAVKKVPMPWLPRKDVMV